MDGLTLIELRLTDIEINKLETCSWHCDKGPSCEGGWPSDEMASLRQKISNAIDEAKGKSDVQLDD